MAVSSTHKGWYNDRANGRLGAVYDGLGVIEFDANDLIIYVPTTVEGSILSSSPTGNIGYSTGAGGLVTQQTNASTGVTLNKPCGQITTVALSTAAGAEEVFTVTNDQVGAAEVVAVSVGTYAGAGTPVANVKNVKSGSFDIVITNLHASAALDAAVVVNFIVLTVALA